MQNNKTIKAHNLNVHLYSFDEILGLFDLTYKMTLDDLKRAKRKVLMTHPDKSKLPPEYFFFYKRAFEMVVQYFDNNNKQNQPLTQENTDYKPLSNTFNKSTVNKVSSIVNEMKPETFQKKFNQLFDENMSTKPDTTRNEWFSKEEPVYTISETVSSKNIGQVFDSIKQTNSSIVKYQGVRELGRAGTSFYEDAEDDDTYVTCDPFSKLKYDDLRKVHKDETIFSVSERDFANVAKYSSVDHFVRARSDQTLTPLDKTESEQLFAQQESALQQRIARQQHASELRTMSYAEKNKAVLSNFLALHN
jgi:hypothetical protein